MHSISVIFSHGCSRIHYSWSLEAVTHQCSLWFVFFSPIKSILRFKSFQELFFKNVFGYFCFNCLVLMSWNSNYVILRFLFCHNYHCISNHSTSLFSIIYFLVSSIFFYGTACFFVFLLFHAFNSILLSLKALSFAISFNFPPLIYANPLSCSMYYNEQNY